MQSGRRMQGKAGRQKNKHQNSFAPSDNSINNEFASNQSGAQQQLQSQMLPNNSKNYQKSSRFDEDNRSQQQKPSKNSKNEKNYGRKEQRMQAIREENIEIRKGSPVNIKKKNPSSLAPSQASRKGQDYYKQPQKRIQRISQNDEYQQPEIQQGRKIQNLNMGMEKLSQSIVDLREKYQQFQKQQSKHKLQKDDTSKIYINSPKNYQKHLMFGQKSSEEIEKQFAQYRKKENKQKESRRKVLEQIAKKQKARIQQQRKAEQKRKSEQKQQKMNDIKALHNFQQKHKKLKQQQAQQKKVIQQYRKKFEKNGSLTLIKKSEQKDKQEEKKRFDEQKQFLADRKQMFKPIDFDKINQHQKWYYEKLQQIQNSKRERKQAKLKQIDDKNAQFPQFYRGSAHSVALEERLQKIRKKKHPQQKVKRIKEYKQYVREHFVPKTYENRSLKNSNIKDDASKTHRQIKRYRYYKGISYGQMIQNRPVAKSVDEIKRMGNGNFQFMKKIPKRRSNSPQIQAYEVKLMQNMRYAQRLKREDHYLSQQKIIKDTKIVLNQNVEVGQLKMIMKRLKANDEKLKHKQHALNSQPQIFNTYTQQKQINQQLVDNLERKLSLLSQL